jgi:hypothetical protein
MPFRLSALAGGLLVSLPLVFSTSSAQEPLPWQRSEPRYQSDDAYRRNEPATRAEDLDDPDTSREPPRRRDARPSPSRPDDAYSPRYASPRPPADDAYRPPQNDRGYDGPRGNDAYSPPRPSYVERPYAVPGRTYSSERYGEPSASPGQPSAAPGQPYGRPYAPPPDDAEDNRGRRYGANDHGRRDERYEPGPRPYEETTDGSYSTREILETGHGFFGSVSKGLASVIEYAFQKQGRPNGYILGQDAGGAFVAGLRYGEGILYTKDAGSRRVYWQGPSIGYDAGAEGSKVMMLVYDLSDPEEIYQRFGGVDGSAYFIGGVGVTFQKSGNVVVAPIRSGVGLRLGANIGYLKYTRRPTWNPF